MMFGIDCDDDIPALPSDRCGRIGGEDGRAMAAKGCCDRVDWVECAESCEVIVPDLSVRRPVRGSVECEGCALSRNEPVACCWRLECEVDVESECC